MRGLAAATFALALAFVVGMFTGPFGFMAAVVFCMWADRQDRDRAGE